VSVLKYIAEHLLGIPLQDGVDPLQDPNGLESSPWHVLVIVWLRPKLVSQVN